MIIKPHLKDWRRSFYVSAILEAVELSLLKTLGLPRVVTLMDGGGKLILLLPNFDGLQTTIEKFFEKMEKQLAESTHGRLRLFLGLGDAFDKHTFFPDKRPKISLKDAYYSAFVNLDKTRRKPLMHYLKRGEIFDIEKFCIDAEFNPEKKACAACGKMPGLHEAKEDNEKTDYYCEQCYDHKKIGELLTKCKYIWYLDKQSIRKGIDLPITEFKIYLSDKDTAEEKIRLSKEDKDVVSISYLWDNEKEYQPYRTVYIANYIPRGDKGEPLTFEDIANRAIEGDEGVAKLAVFKADVDNMGLLFDSIWKRDKAQLTFMVSVSRMLSFFFGGILENRLETAEKNIYTVYAGGDDMFLIGSWKEILEEAGEWRNMFDRYVAGHPKITFSAGVALAAPGHPINRMKDDAEEQLEKAKKCDGKNRIAIWDKTLKWNEDWDNYIIKEKARLDNWIKAEALNTAAAYRLLRYARMAERTKDKSSRLDDYLWQSKMRYDLARNFRDSDNQLKQKIAEELWPFTLLDADPEIQKEQIKQFSQIYTIPLTWALYLNRWRGKGKEKENEL